MATRVEVPGQGVVEFPDGMDDAAIAAAIKKTIVPPQPAIPKGKPGDNPGVELTFDPVATAAARQKAAAPPAAGPEADAYFRAQGLAPNAAGTEYTKAAGKLLSKAAEPITSYPAAESRIAHEAATQVGQGLSDLRPQIMGGPKGKTASGLWDTAAGALRFTGAPIEAGLETVVGKPLEENFGIPAEWSKFAAGLAIPYYGLRGSPVQTGAKKIFTPEAVSPKAEEAAGLIRGEQGQAARDTQSSMQAVDQYHRPLNALDTPGKLDFFKYMEGRSTGATLPPALTHLQPVADELRKGFKQREADLNSISRTANMSFVEDYFPHMWKDPKKAQDFLFQFGGKEGSGRSTKARSIPTIEDGLKAGLELKSENPLAVYQAYISNMDRFTATERVFETARNNGTIQYYHPGKQPADWMEVKSRLGDTTGGTAYAPADWARIYNNFTSRGYAELGPEFGSAYTAARMASNAVTALELSLSGYHALTMGQEAIINEVARSIQQGARGSPVKALWSAAKAPLAPFSLARTGGKAEKVYLGTTVGTPEQKAVVDLLTEAGARFKGRAHAADLGSSAAGSFFDAWRKGSLKTELLSDWRDMKGAPVKGTAGVIARNVGRTMDTIMHPLFQTYIPKLKNGAAYENMADWLRANPLATKDEQLAAARKIVDSIDNRFGEMIQDNIFWNQLLKQSAMVAMRSYSWNLGTIREIAGGATDVLGGKGFTQRAAYNIALPIVYGMTGAMYQYLNTGQPPQDTQDFIAPRTGGTDPRSGLPERITPPGYMKDVLGWSSDPRQEAKNKIATAPRLLGEAMFSGTDWRNDPIAPPGVKGAPMPANVPSWLKAYFEHVAEALGPISVKNAMQGAKRGSNLSAFERVLGLQPSGMSKTDPEGFERMMRGIEERKWKAKQRHDETTKKQFGGPVE